jgi:ABC-2 type transport system ATP-binding protein
MSGLDPIGRREIRELIAGLRTQGKTVFMSTHILSDIEALCDEVAILRNGKLTATGNLNDLLTSESGHQGFEVTVANINSDQLKTALNGSSHLAIESRAGGSIIRCSDEADVERILDIARKNGGRLVGVQMVKQSLEDYFTTENN